MVTAVPPREWANSLPEDFKVSPRVIESVFGHETMKSDYSFVKTLYEFTPDKMNHWALSQRGLNRDEFLLMIKSLSLLKSADTGIFNEQNSSYKGFQQGNLFSSRNRAWLLSIPQSAVLQVSTMARSSRRCASALSSRTERWCSTLAVSTHS